ncbi:MAG TPA: IS1595 family transposase [Candidatus Saccharimonas sp.]|nr:IS1595 family transposase [Candidatus Saccharimonas sp.]
MENKYLKRSHISEAKFRQVVRLFCEDMTATQIASLTGLNRNTVNRLLTHIRQVIARYCDSISPLSGEVEIDESYFGPRRVRGVRGRGAGRKIIVFGLLKRQGKVYTQIVPNVSRETLKQIVQAKVEPDSTIYSDGWRSYDGLVDWGYKRHYRVSHGENEFVARNNPRNHINGIENFWGIAKVRLTKLRGLRKDHFNLHLKECEFRYNMRHEDMYKKLLELLRKEACD